MGSSVQQLHLSAALVLPHENSAKGVSFTPHLLMAMNIRIHESSWRLERRQWASASHHLYLHAKVSTLDLLYFWRYSLIKETVTCTYNHRPIHPSTHIPRLSKNLQIHYLLVVISCKHKEIFNYYWHNKVKLN